MGVDGIRERLRERLVLIVGATSLEQAQNDAGMALAILEHMAKRDDWHWDGVGRAAATERKAP